MHVSCLVFYEVRTAGFHVEKLILFHLGQNSAFKPEIKLFTPFEWLRLWVCHLF